MDGIPDQGPCWVDVMSSDRAAAERFYRELFGWRCVPVNHEGFGDYSVFLKEGLPVAGFGANTSSFADSWTTYLSVEDVEIAQAEVIRHGGTVLMPTMDNGAFGKMAVMTGPGKAVVGLWQRLDYPGFRCLDAPGYPIWHSLNTYRFDAVFNFYCTIMDWIPQLPKERTEVRYATFRTGDSIRVLIYDAAAAAEMKKPSRWSVSFGVADLAESVRNVERAGGRVLVEPFETFFGGMALVADPGGAEFYLAPAGNRPLVMPRDPWDISWVSEL